MKRFAVLLAVLLYIMAAAGCQPDVREPLPGPAATPSDTPEPPDFVSCYVAAVTDLFSEAGDYKSNAEILAFDLTKTTRLSAAEKAELLKVVSDMYQTETMEATLEELTAQGYIDEYGFTSGCLITIEDVSYDAQALQLSYKISVYRGPETATGSDDVHARFNGTEWVISYDKAFWIS